MILIYFPWNIPPSAPLWQQYTVYPKKYAHSFCFAVLCCGYTLTDFPISIRLTSLALWQSNDCPSASKQRWWIWINTSCEFVMNDCITTTKQSTTKPCAYSLGYTVRPTICRRPCKIHFDKRDQPLPKPITTQFIRSLEWIAFLNGAKIDHNKRQNPVVDAFVVSTKVLAYKAPCLNSLFLITLPWKRRAMQSLTPAIYMTVIQKAMNIRAIIPVIFQCKSNYCSTEHGNPISAH